MFRLNYHHLQYFHAIATHGSIAKASTAIHITPQTLSAQLSLLEQQLGCSLFDRKGKRLILNDMGRTAFSYSQKIFGLGDELLHTMKNHSSQFDLRFSLGVTDVIAKVFSFNLLKSLYEMNDSIKLVCRESSLDLLLGELAINKLDAILSDIALPTGSPIKAYSHLLGKCGLSFFAAKSLAATLSDGFPHSLNQTAMFTAGEGSNQHLNVVSWFGQQGIAPSIIGEFDDSALVKYFGQAGLGVFCAPSIIEDHVIEQFDVALVGRTADITEHFYLISPQRKIKHPVVKHLLNEGRKLFKAE